MLIGAQDATATNRTSPSTPVAPTSRYRVGSSQWWLDRLTRALVARMARFEMLAAYYRGTEPRGRLATTAWVESGLSTVFPQALSTNHSRLIVNASAQRLTLLGFRLAGQARVDTEAARIWRANDMESLFEIALTESLVRGECPILVEPNPDDPRTPLITPQDPASTIVWTSPGDRRIREAALKTWWDDTTRLRQYILYLPDRVERWRESEPGQMALWLDRLFAVTPSRWTPAGPTVANPLGEVPVVVLPNEPLLAGSPEAEHEAVLTQVDHYNRTLMDMAVTAQELAFPQRWGTGVDEPSEEDTEEQPAVAATNRVQGGQTRWLTTPAPDAQFGQFAAATLENYVKALDVIRAGIATVSFTPYHFLLNMPTSVPPSGESITAAEAPLTDKVRSHQRDKGSATRTVMRLAFLLGGDPQRAERMRMGQTLWADPERRTESQHIDALAKLASIGVPEEALWEMIPVAPEEIARWQQLVAAEPAPAAAGAPSNAPADPGAGAAAATTAATPTPGSATPPAAGGPGNANA